jgi:hypothetical protein
MATELPETALNDPTSADETRFAVAYHTEECAACGRPLPPYVTADHRVVVATNPEELINLYETARQRDSKAHISALPTDFTATVTLKEVMTGTVPHCHGPS